MSLVEYSMSDMPCPSLWDAEFCTYSWLALTRQHLPCSASPLTCTFCYRQLGISLHTLDSALPLYDGLTGERIGEDLDRY